MNPVGGVATPATPFTVTPSSPRSESNSCQRLGCQAAITAVFGVASRFQFGYPSFSGSSPVIFPPTNCEALHPAERYAYPLSHSHLILFHRSVRCPRRFRRGSKVGRLVHNLGCCSICANAVRAFHVSQ